MSLPARLKTHTISVEPYEGAGPFGAVFGDAVSVACRVEEEMKPVTTDAGVEVVSSTTIYCDLTEIVPTESRVTVAGRVTTVVKVRNHDTGGRSALEHKEVNLL